MGFWLIQKNKECSALASRQYGTTKYKKPKNKSLLSIRKYGGK
jgi:hypothetical protein